MLTLFHEILYRPLFNGLVFLYNTAAFEDLGLAIILLTILIRILFYPLFFKSFKNQILLQKIQPEIKKIQHSHKKNREAQAQALLSLYKQHKVNPFSGFLLILVQLPILIALYRVFLNGFSLDQLTDLYSFIAEPSALHNTFLNLIDLSKPSIVIVGLAAASQYFQGKISIPKTPPGAGPASPAEKIGRQMVFIGPIITLVILFNLPAAIGVYWLTTSVFSIIQHILVQRSLNHGTLPDQSKNPL